MYAGSNNRHLGWWMVLLVLSVGIEASAQHVQLLTQTPTQSSGLVVDGTQTVEPSHFELALGLNYARRPVLEQFESDTQPVYGGVLSPSAVLTYGFNERLQLSFTIPWHRITTDSPAQPDTSTGFGLQTRWRIRSAIEGRGLSSAVVLGMNTAFEDKGNLISAGGAILYGRSVWQYGFELMVLRLSVGYEHDTSSKTALQSHAGGAQAVTFGGGLEVGHPEGALVGFLETSGKRLLPRGNAVLNQQSVEALVGIRVKSDSDVAMSLGAGRGITEGFGASAMRVMLQLNWQFESLSLPLSGASAFQDTDNDGVADSFDRCPHEREDRDQFEDGDGCPEADNDRDGLPDAVDKCPSEAEDKDGFLDDDGCLDADNDQDGVPDAEDACPNDDRHNNAKTHPNGCPLIQIHGSRLTIASSIRFASGSANLADTANSTLKELVTFMHARPHTDRLRVEGYTDLWGNSKQNRRLGEQRARAVKKRLISLGLAQHRIEAFGRATESPIGDGRAPDAAKQSRRVEFYLSLSERKRLSE
jgi:outer membrane protein OmpA-like peptidoglycan-associated protein